MGRPFAEELDDLTDTHRWACREPIESLIETVRVMQRRPLVAVGSGGSLTTAAMAATLFSHYAAYPAQAVTPLRLSAMRSALRHVSVFIATAGGSNPDVIGAMREAAKADAPQVLALCGKVKSKLSNEATRFSNVNVEGFALPTNGDGFLATNSLWASCVLLVRAFAAANNVSLRVPVALAKIVGKSRWSAFVKQSMTDVAPLWERNTVIVLHGTPSYPAALDLESKLSEAALSDVWIADYRHFAHGRHHWLAKRGASSAIIAYVDETEQELANRTLQQIPSSVPVHRIDVPASPVASLAALAHVFPIIASAGEARGIDPGRPGVPAFGRNIYRINAFGKLAPRKNALPEIEAIAIERKAGLSIRELERAGSLKFWRSAYSKAVSILHSGRYHGIVLDYDGTLCGPTERFGTLVEEVAAYLRTLLSANVSIGIATGRGKSVRESLQQSLPKKDWKRVILGYYNGGQIGTLADDATPDGHQEVGESLLAIYEALRSHSRLTELATIEPRRTQITISSADDFASEECWELANHVVHRLPQASVQLYRSSHSFDIVPHDVTKRAVIERIKDIGESDVLAIGDMGRWPGNDYQLLAEPHSLSVDEVSPSPTSCWNFASPGVRGVDAALEYFSRMRVNPKGWFKVKTRHQAGAQK